MTEDKEPSTNTPDDKAFPILPWHVTEALTQVEATEVSAHVDNCARCREEIATLIGLKHAVIASNETLSSPEPELLARVLNRIENYEAARAGRTHEGTLVDRWHERLSAFWLTWGRMAFATQLAVLLLLVIALVITAQRARSFADRAASEQARADHGEQLLKETQQRYETLAGPNNLAGTSSARLTVAFQERATEKEVRELLNRINGTIVSGPSPQHIYVIAVPVANDAERDRVVDAALKQLQANPQTVLFAAEQGE